MASCAGGFGGTADFDEALGDGARGGLFEVVGCGVGMVLARRARGGKEGSGEERGGLRHAAAIALTSAFTFEVSRILRRSCDKEVLVRAVMGGKGGK